jgi:hypothetical protein
MSSWMLRIVLLLCALPGTRAAAQTTDQLLADRRGEYRAAVAIHEAAQRAYEVVDRRFSTAMDEITRARQGNDEDALERALAAALDQSVPVQDQGRRVREAAQDLEVARLALVQVITVRLTELVARIDVAPSVQERNELDALWRDLNFELESLETEGEDPLRLSPVVAPEVVFDPRDTPEDREAKAQILERTAAMADSAIVDLDEQIVGLQDRLRQERQIRDFRARADRFGDTPPVVPARPAGELPVQAADSAGVQVRPPTLEERIEALRTSREAFMTYRNDLLIRAAQFRRPPGRSRA